MANFPSAVPITALTCVLRGIGHVAADALHSLKVVRVDARKAFAEWPQNAFDAIIGCVQGLAGAGADRGINSVDRRHQINAPCVFPHPPKILITLPTPPTG